MRKLCILLVLLLGLSSQVIMAQTNTVTGKVTSTTDGSALGDVSVRLKGAIIAAKTGPDGLYSIEVDPQSSSNPYF